MLSKFIGSVFIVAGISIGAGMLAMPLTAGFIDYPTCLLTLFIFWVVMYYATLFNLEATLRIGQCVSTSEITTMLFGRTYGTIVSLSYGTLLLSLVAAYIAGETSLIQSALNTYIHLSPSLISIIFTITFGLIIYAGISKLDRFNRLFLSLKFIFLACMIFFLSRHIEISNLESREAFSWNQWSILLPVFFTSFGFQVCIPYLVNYCEYDTKLLRGVIFAGTLIPFLAYAIWLFVAKGTLPLEGSLSFTQLRAQGGGVGPFIDMLSLYTGSLEVKLFNMGYSLLAMTTSFLGVGMALYLFVGEKFSNLTQKNSLITLTISFLPAWLIVQLYPEGFVMALKYAGSFLSIFALIAPAACVWKLRSNQDSTPYEAPGGKMGLVTILIIGIVFAWLGI